MTATTLETPFHRYHAHLLERYEPFPRGKYVSLLLLRKTESETLFRTEGGDAGVVKELTVDGDGRGIQRVVMTKRKATAVERRTGRELLRRHGLLQFERISKKGKKKGEVTTFSCALNRNEPCEQCIDCYTYGYAVGGGGAQKSRVWTADAFSVLEASAITDRRTLNSTFDDGTMRDPETKKPTTAFVPDMEYIRPDTHFVDLQTVKDVTAAELTYVVGNILRSTRYGAVSSRLGRMKNDLLAVAFSTMEGPSPLELTSGVFRRLGKEEGPLLHDDVRAALLAEFKERIRGLPSKFTLVEGKELVRLLGELNALFQDEERLKRILDAQTKAYPSVE